MSQELVGRVVSLHLHPAKPGMPLNPVDFVDVVAGKGIDGEPRYFGRISQATGQPSRRQVSLIEREQIVEHAASLGLEIIPPGAVRANIETLGIDLIAWSANKLKSAAPFFSSLNRAPRARRWTPFARDCASGCKTIVRAPWPRS